MNNLLRLYIARRQAASRGGVRSVVARIDASAAQPNMPRSKAPLTPSGSSFAAPASRLSVSCTLATTPIYLRRSRPRPTDRLTRAAGRRSPSRVAAESVSRTVSRAQQL